MFFLKLTADLMLFFFFLFVRGQVRDCSEQNYNFFSHTNIVFCWKAGTSHKMLFVLFVFSKSRFQGRTFRCDKIVLIVTLLEAIEGIPDKDYNFGGAKTSTNFTRDYFMRKNEWIFRETYL